MDIVSRIQQLKNDQNALILSHFYEDGAIQDIADRIGDSLALAEWGAKEEAPVILLAGVVFMGETVKILSPEKTVLVPDRNAGCSLVDESPFDKYLEWRRSHPDAVLVSYVNSSAAVKSITDVCVTSSNAEKIISAIPENRQILFGPDRNLGRFLSRKLKREMILWPGACQVHVLFSARKLFELKSEHPGAPILAHPECEPAVLEYADVVGSTARLLKEVVDGKFNKYIVATEAGIFHQMKKARPDVELIQAPIEGSCACNECPYMKLNTLAKVEAALKDLSPQIEVASNFIEKARVGLHRMMKITHGEKVEWPASFKD